VKRKYIFLFLSALVSGFVCGAEEDATKRAILPHIPIESSARPAFEAFRNGRVTDALELARPLVNQGNADAKFLYAFATEISPSSPTQVKSRQDAMDYFYRAAAEAGQTDARFRLLLANMKYGDETQKSKSKEILETEANSNNPTACRVLGEAWMTGACDGKANLENAIKWWRKASELGDADSFVPLGASLLQDGPHHDESAARGWLEKAIQKQYYDASLVLGNYEKQVKKNKEAAMRCYQVGADAGHGACMLRVSEYLLENDKNSQAGYEWLKKSADSGNPEASYKLGKKLLAGGEDGVRSAYQYLLAAANDGIWQAQYEVAMIQLNGKLGGRDPVAAYGWLSKAMNSNDPETLYQLALLNEWGMSGRINYSNAGMLYNLACTIGHGGAAGRIAQWANQGIRLPQSSARAWAYATLATERGDESSKALLVELDKKLSEGERAEARKILVGLIDETEKAARKIRE
jgi:uncharacterized protein